MNKLMYASIALALLAGSADAKNGRVYKVYLGASPEFTYQQTRMNARRQYGVDIAERLRQGAIVEVCKDTAKKPGDPWVTCRYLVPALPAAATYTVYDNRTNVGAPGWGYRHDVTLREAHDKGLKYRVCRVDFVTNPAVRPPCQTW